MKYKIIDIKPRNILARLLFAEDYKVTVQLEDGRILKFDLAAGYTLDPAWVIKEVEERIKKEVRSKEHLISKVKFHEGTIEG